MHVGGSLHHDFGKLLEDLWHPVAVPDGEHPVHRGRDEEGGLGPGCCGMIDCSEKLEQDALDPLRNRAHGAVGAGHEVGDAGQHNHVGLSPDLTKRLGQNIEPSTGDALSSKHQWPISAVERSQISNHIRVAE